MSPSIESAMDPKTGEYRLVNIQPLKVFPPISFWKERKGQKNLLVLDDVDLDSTGKVLLQVFVWYQAQTLVPSFQCFGTSLVNFGTRGLHNIPWGRFVTVGARC